MAEFLKRLFGSFVSAFACCFLNYQDHHTAKTTHNFRAMPKGRPLSLQVNSKYIFVQLHT